VGIGQEVQVLLRLAGEAEEEHGHRITGVTGPIAGDHHAAAIKFSRLAGGLERDSHLSPDRKRLGRPELNAVLSDSNTLWRQSEFSTISLNYEWLE